MQKRRGWFLTLPIIGMLAHGGNGVPQHGKVRKGFGLILGLAQQGGGVEGAHEQDAALIDDASLPGSSSVSVCPQAVPARFPPAYGFFLVRSCRGGASPKKHSGLQPIMLLSRYNVVL